MTRWNAIPLRQQGKPWPGLNTAGGKIDPGVGFLEDGSFNAIINEEDILEKRKGMIRGLDERFDGPVCGLFRYTDECGAEYVVVADSSGINVRTPFNIPVFLGSDSLPNDGFDTLDTTRWSPTTDYEVFQGALQLNILSSLTSDEFVSESRLMQWFKPSVLTSYQVEIEYEMVAGSTLQVVSVVIKRTGSTYLEAVVFLNGSDYFVRLNLVQAGVRSDLQQSVLQGSALANGFLRLSYNSETRIATVRVIPSGGSQVTLSSTLSEAQDANLGQNSAIGIARESEDQVQIAGVTGSAL